MEISYDEDSDVLYVSFGEAEQVETEHRDDDVLIRRDASTGEVVGVTVIGFRSRNEIEIADIAEIPA